MVPPREWPKKLADLIWGWRWPWLVALAIFGGIALVILRGEFGGASGALPRGTNALNAYTLFQFDQRHPFSIWLAPYTDWGQPLPIYPGIDPENLLAFSGVVTPTIYVRLTEFLDLTAAGLSMCWAVRQFRGTGSAAIVAGVFYELTAEVPHFFEGHLGTMTTLALAPLLVVLTLRFFEAPRVLTGIGLAIVVYLCASVGDLGSLYRILFFASFIALAVIVHRLLSNRYTRRETVITAVAAVVLLALLLPWIATYVGGVRPQFTTGITVATQPFSRSTGQNLFLSFIGASGDNSYSYFALNSSTYAWDLPRSQYLFAVIPLVAGVYAAVFGGIRERLLYAGGVFALILSTGPNYPSLSLVNRSFYDHFPLFNTDSLLYHWNSFYIFAVGLLLGLAVSRWQCWLEGAPWKTNRRVSEGAGEVRPAEPTTEESASTGAGLRYRPTNSAGRRPGVAALVVVSVLIVCAVSPMLENWEAFSAPPGVFDYPSDYTSGYSYVGAQPPLGGVLSVPFGTIYERTPWGGVSASSGLVAGLSTDRNLAIFEAGTPQSLSLDRVIGDGLGKSDSNNMTKLLNATGIQYVVSTDYPDPKYASDAEYNPSTSVRGLAEQQGLGSPVFRSGYQTVFAILSPASNVSAFHGYYVYDGAEPLLFEIENEPWYSSSTGLVDLESLPASELGPVIMHSLGFVTNATNLGQLSSGIWGALSNGSTPVAVLLGGHDYNRPAVFRYPTPWNSSNGVSFGTPPSNASITFDTALSTLRAHGFTAAMISSRAEGAPGAVATLATDAGASISGSVTSSAGSPSPLPYWNRSIVSAGINNHNQYHYNGSVDLLLRNGTKYLDWKFAPNNTTYQYLSFALGNFAGVSGLSITLKSPFSEPSPIVANLRFGNESVTVPSYLSNISLATNSVTESFFFPSAEGSLAQPFLQNLSQVTRFTIGFPATGTQDNLLLSNVSTYSAPASGFITSSLGTLNLRSASNLTLSAGSAVHFDTITVWAGRGPISVSPRQDDYAAQGVLTDESFRLTGSGWSLVQLPQVYSALWHLDGPVASSYHLVTNVGLNGWLVNTSGPVALTIVYEGVPLLHAADIAEGSLLLVIAVALVYSYRRAKRVPPRTEPDPTLARESHESSGEGILPAS